VTDVATPRAGNGPVAYLRRATRFLRLLRIQPYDTSTPEGRSAERYRRVALSTALSALGKFVAMGTGMVSLPLVYSYLSDGQYGMWVAMTSVVAALGPLDLGLGLGLLTMVADATGRDDRETARRAISTAVAMLTFIASIATLVFVSLYFVVPWARFFNVTDPAAVADAGPTIAVLFGAFALGLPLSTIAQVQLAHQSGYVSSAWAIVANVGSLLAVILVVNLHGGLPVLVAALTGMGLLGAASNGVMLYGFQRPWLRPRLGDVSLRMARPLFRTGAFFLVLQLAALAAYQLDNFVIIQVMGDKAVAQYAIPVKLFTFASTLLSFVLTPLWPAYRESMARGDIGWTLRTLRRSIKLAAAVNVPNALILLVAAPSILDLWVNHWQTDPTKLVHPAFILLAGLAVWGVMNTFNGPFAMFLNGANVVGFQAACSILMAIANVTISIILVQHIGVAGAVWGSVISQFVFVLVPQAWFIRRYVRRLEPRPAPGPAA
jgi:O-antigen/teichoic acid export membrane protein